MNKHAGGKKQKTNYNQYTQWFRHKLQMWGSNILLPSTHKQREMAGLRLLHLQFAQQKCIYMYMEGMYFCNTFLQVHITLPWML